MFFDFLFFVVVFILLNIFVMICVAFLNLLERSLLDYIHIRKGYNSVGFVGVLQPFNNSISIFTKEKFFPLSSNFYITIFLLFLGFPLLVNFYMIHLF